MTKQERAEIANQMLAEIGSCGRKFFAHNGRVSRFEVDERGRVWLIDKYKERRVYTHYLGRWNGFTEGGTLRRLIERMRDFIRDGSLLPAGIFGPWPEWICGGDLWAYGEDMQRVRDAALRLGITQEPASASALSVQVTE